MYTVRCIVIFMIICCIIITGIHSLSSLLLPGALPPQTGNGGVPPQGGQISIYYSLYIFLFFSLSLYIYIFIHVYIYIYIYT